MTIPKWLLPVIGLIAAVAVGIAAVLIGMQFAKPATGSAFAPPLTQTATVLAPVSVGDADTDGEAEGEAGGDSEEPAPSPEVAEREVAVPEEDPAASDAETLNLINLLALDPDILAGILDLGLGTLGGDPCSPADGSEPPAECPPGLMGAIFADRLPPPFISLAEAWPRTHAELGDVRTGIGELQCDPPTPAEGQATVRVRSTLPGTWTVRYYPTEHPEDAVTTVESPPTDQQLADWQTQFEMEPIGYIMAEQCLVIDGLDADTAYTAVITGHDPMGRDAAPRTVLFNGDGAPTHPAISVQPIGQNLLTVSALHRADENVILQGYLMDDASAEATCDPSDGTYVHPLTEADDIPTTAAERNTQNVERSNSQKLFYSYRVPEGATLVLCARWFPAGSAPSWESAQATHESSVIVQTADRVNPVLTLTDFIPRDDRTVQLDWTTSTAEGLVCNDAQWRSGDAVGFALCDSWFTNSGGIDHDYATDRLSDRGFDGDLVLGIGARLSSGETSETAFVFPAGAGSCVGLCVPPATRTYHVATIGGTMVVEERWVQGLTNGLDDWHISSTVSNPIDYVRPDTPQIDTSQDWTFVEPDDFRNYVTAELDLRVDRHVTWEVSVIDGRTGRPALRCNDTSQALADSGESEDGIARIALEGMCVSQEYYVSIRLVDDAGIVSVYDQLDRSHWWVNGFILSPMIDITLRYQVVVDFDPELIDNRDYFKRFNLMVDGNIYPLPNDEAIPPGTLCIDPIGHAQSDGTLELTVGKTVEIGAETRFGNREEPGSSECSGSAWTGSHGVLTSSVPIAAFNNPDGVLVDWGDAVSVKVRVWAERR